MKKIHLLLILFCLLMTSSIAQIHKDTSRPSPQNDTLSVGKFGTYVSLGIGLSRANEIPGAIAMFGLSLAYKTTLFSFSRAGGGTIHNYVGGKDEFYETDYTALLLGKAYRSKHTLISFSGGLAYTNIEVDHGRMPYNLPYDESGIISIPLEFNFFLLAGNALGIGVHVSKDLVPKLEFSPFYLCFSLVGGVWNDRHPM